MKLGFSGTQEGMNERQRNQFIYLVKHLKFSEFHHGDCIGADEQAHELIVAMHVELGSPTIVIHPPTDNRKRAYCLTKYKYHKVIIYPSRPYLERNKSIVNNTMMLCSAPNTQKEVLRSGTWSTYRYARKMKITTIILIR